MAKEMNPNAVEAATYPIELGAQSFHLEEYKTMRTEVADHVNKAERLLQGGVLVSAAVFSWLATASLGQQATGKLCSKMPLADLPVMAWLWSIPAAAVVVIGLLGFARYKRVNDVGSYLLRLEDALGIKQLGWEKHLSKRSAFVSISSVIAWMVLAVATIFMAYSVPDRLANLSPCETTKGTG